jgi:uncharacterized membrane protein
MTIGPVQLIVVGFNHPEFHGKIISELERLHDERTVGVIDSLAVHKDGDGEIEVQHLSNLSKEEAIEVGSVVGALVGLGVAGEEGAEQGAALGAEAATNGVEVFSEEKAWDVIEEIPNDSAAALILLEHHWAVPLRDGSPTPEASGSVTGSSARSLEVGLVSAEEAKQLHAAETAAAVH